MMYFVINGGCHLLLIISTGENHFYCIYYGLKLFEDLLRLCATNIQRCIVALRPVMLLPSKVHNSKVDHWGLDICKRLSEVHQRPGVRDITDRMISEVIRQCPPCQVKSRMRLQIKAH
jgi:hypothetical protein